jgi:ABC-type lipoprotein export system ATPase subunit
MTAILEARNLQKSYRDGSVVTAVLHGVGLAVEPGEFVAIMGPSGCGKSTLLYVLGLLTHHDSGTVRFEGRDISALGGTERTRLRRERMGFVFQRFNLLPALSAEDNVAMPLRLRGEVKGDGAAEMLDRVGLADKRHKRPGQMSIGEQQRVAIARSLIGRPAILFADEPTGNLDSENGEKILSILGDFHRGQGQTIIMVTHNEEAALRADRIIRMKDGRCING